MLGLGSVFYGPYMAIVERLASAGRARVTADLRRRRGQAARGRPAPRSRPRPRGAGSGDRERRRRRRPRAHEHERARAARARRARRRQARAGREADGDLARRGGGAHAARGRVARASGLRAAHPALAHVPRRRRARRGRRHRPRCCWRERATAGRAPTGAAGSTSRGGGRALRPRRLQRDRALRLLRPGAARDGDGRRRDPGARRRGRDDAGAGRGQRACPDRLRRGALRLGHDRLHMQKYRSPAIELYGSEGVRAGARRRLGARGLRALAQRARHLGAPSRSASRNGSGPRACATSSTASSRGASR